MLDKRPGTIQDMFDRISPTYDRLNTILSLSIDQLWRHRTIRHLDIGNDSLVLDAGTGTGNMGLLAVASVGCRVVGIDLSREMLAVAARKGRSTPLEGQFLLANGNALMLPFRDQAFDRAMVAFGIRNMEHPDLFLDEIHRVLKDEGRLAVLEFSLPRNPLIRRLYLFYFTILLPAVGGIISGYLPAYKYLRDSVMAFTPPEDLENTMKARGFSILRSRDLFFGVSHLYVLGKTTR